MANVNANVNVIVNTQQAVTQLRLLTAEINNFNKQSFAANSAAAQQQKALNQALVDGVRTSGKFSTSIVPITSSVDKFSESLERNRLNLGQYTRYAASQLPGMRKVLTREFDMINSLAEERVKKLNTQFVRIGQSANGMQQALAMTPNALDQFSSRSAIALQRQQIFNRLLRDGSTQLLNYGKNTQWAGRQLMVGFTIPLALLGAQAAKVFKELEAEAINFKKVYGDMFTTDKEVEQNLSAIKELAKEMTKYGQSAQQTMQLANTAAQSGARGEGLMAATTQATRLAILGQMEQAQAIETTISLQTAFSLSNEKLAESINFLNSVENQTILSLQDVSEAIPRVASVINGFGGNVQDLSVLLVAMKEGGVSAAEGSNALKNSMARIISPTRNALDITAKYGISLQEIVSRNKGQIVPLFMELSKALEAIGGQPRQEVLSAVFGKFQYARMGTLLSNIAKEGSQAAKAIELTSTSTRDLASTAEKELGTVENSISTKFTAALEKAKIALAPVGGEFLKALTPVLEVISKILGKFDELPGGIKTAIVAATAIIGGIAPVLLMVVGLVANGIANISKFIMFLRKQIGVLRGNGEQFKQYSMAELEAGAATASLEGKTSSLTKTMLLQKPAIESLITLYARLAASAKLAAASMPTTMGMPGAPAGRGSGFYTVASRLPMVRRNSGGPIFESSGGKTMVPGSGNTDTVPAMLTPGEFVINKKATQKNFSLIKAINDGEINTNSQSKTIPAIKPQVQKAYGGAWIARFINSSWRSSAGRNSAPSQLRDAIPQTVRNEVENNLKTVLSRAGIDSKKLPESVWKDMSKVDLAHIKPEINKNGQKVWRLKNLMTVPGLENNGLDFLFGKRRVKSRKMFLDVAKKDPEFSKKYAYQIDKIVKNSGHPRTRKDYEFLQELFKKTSSDPQGSAWLKSNSKTAKMWFPALNEVVKDRLKVKGSVLGLPVPIPKDPRLKYNIGGLVAAASAARGARGRIPGNIVDWFSRMTTSINQSSRDDLLQNIPANIKKGLSTSRKNFDITRGSIDPISGGSLKEVSSWSTGQGVGRFMESSRLFETLDNSKFQIAQRSQGIKRDIDMLKDLGPDGPGPGKPYSPFNREDGGILNTRLTSEEIQESGGIIWKANKKKVEARILRDQEFVSGHQKIIDELQESYIPTIYKTSVKKGEKYFDVSERIVPKDDQRISNPAASTEILQEKEIALLKAKLIGKPTTRIVEKTEAQARYDKAKEEIKKLRMQIVRKEVTREEAQPILNRLYDESENMASFVNWGKGREVFYPDVMSTFNKGGMIPVVQKRNAGGKIFDSTRTSRNIVPGAGNTDTVPAMLTPGEFVINKQSTQKNLPLLHAINDGNASGFSNGGMIPGYNMGGMVSLSRFIKKISSMPKSKQEIYFRAGMQTDDPKNMSYSPQSLNIVAYQKRRLLKDKAVGELSALKIPGGMNHTREDMQPLGQSSMFSPSPIGRPWTIGSLAVRPGYETLVSQLLGLTARQTISRSGVLPAASTNLSQHSSRTVEFLAKRGIVKDLRSSKTDFNEVTKKDSKAMIRDAEDAIKSSNEIWKISPKELEQSSNMVRGLLRSTRQKKINNTEQLSLFSNGGIIPGFNMGGMVAKKVSDLRSYLSARHGATEKRSWVDPLNSGEMRSGAIHGPGVYQSNMAGRAREYSGLADLRLAVNRDGFVYRNPRDPMSIARVLRGKGYISLDEVKARGLGTDVASYRQLRSEGYKGVTIPQGNGEVWTVDFSSRMKLANSKTPFGLKQAVTDRKQLRTVRQSEKRYNKANAPKRNADDDLTLNRGGFISPTLKMNNGNIVPGMGSKDTVPAMLTPGEFVINKKSTQKNLQLLHAINDGSLPGYQKGTKDGANQTGKRSRLPGEKRISWQTEVAGNKADEARAGRAARTGFQVQREHSALKTSFERETFRFGTKPENLMSNVLRAGGPGSSPKTRDEYLKRLDKYFQDEKERVKKSERTQEQKDRMKANIDKKRDKMMAKIDNNFALNARERQDQAKVLNGMVKDIERGKLSQNSVSKNFVKLAKQNIDAAKSYLAPSRPGITGYKPLTEPRIVQPPSPKVSGSQSSFRVASNPKLMHEQARTVRMMRESPGVTAAQARQITKLQMMGGRGGSGVPPTPIGMPGGPPDGDGVKPSQSRMAKMSSGIGKFGMGAGMGLSMASMMPMMGADKEGKWMGMDASAAMMGMMGGGMLLSLAPMIPLKLMPPVLAAAAAFGAVAITAKVLNDNMIKAAEKSAEFGANVGGTSNALNTISALFGEKTPAQRSTQLQLQFSKQEQEESFGQFQNYLGNELGQKFLKDFETLTGVERFKKLSDYLRNAISAGVLDEKTAILFAKTVGSSLNDSVLGSSVVADLKKNFQQSGSKGLLTLAESRKTAVEKEQKILPETSEMVGASIQIIQDYSNALALANEEYAQGTISYSEFSSIASKAKAAQEDYSKSLKDSLVITYEASSFAETSGKGAAAFNSEMKKILSEDQFEAMKKATEQGLLYQPPDIEGIGVNAFEGVAKAELGSAIASGMGADQAISIMQEIRDNPDSDLAKIFAERAGKGNALTVAAFSETSDVMAEVLGLTGQMNDKFKKLGIAFLDAGGNIGEFQTFITNLPEKMRGAMIDSLLGMSAEGRQLSITGGSAISGAYGERSQQVLGGRVYGAAQAAVGENDPRFAGAALDLSRFKSVQSTILGLEKDYGVDMAMKIQSAATSLQKSGTTKKSTLYQEGDKPLTVPTLGRGTDSDQRTVIGSLRYVSGGENVDLDKWLQDAGSLSRKVSEIQNNFPPEILSRISIDFTNPQQIDLWSNSAVAFSKNVSILSQLNPNIDISASMRFLTVDANGKQLTSEEITKNTIALNKAWKNLQSSENVEVRRKAMFTIISSYQDAAGNLLSEKEITKGIDSLVDKFGGKVYQLDPTIIYDSIKMQTDASDLRKQASALQKIVGGLTGESAQIVNRRINELLSIAGSLENKSSGTVKAAISNLPQKDSSGGGGGGQESPLKSFLKGILDQVKMWIDASAKMGDLNKAKESFSKQILKGNGIFDKLNNAKGINVNRLQEIMGMGPEGAQDFIKKYVKDGKLTKEGKTILDKATATGAAQTIGENVISARTAGMQTRAGNIAVRSGASKEAVASIAGDSKKSAELVRIQRDVDNGVKGAVKAKKEFIQSEEKAIKKAKDLEEFLKGPTERAIEDITKKHEVNIKALDKEIEKQEGIIEAIQKQIDKLDEKNDDDQWAIRGLERQKELIERQVEILQRANELDQRRIETLQRQDELRNRESEALSYELDAMSQIEEKIRESYGKRLEALDKVAKVNDYLINQQKQQLGLSQAISEGDIYAATAATQEMRASSAQFASEQARSSLEQGMENSVEGLRTSGGLTREQAEERMKEIKEQSYQTSLLIRNIEDAIYSRNQEMIPLKDQQRILDDQIRIISDSIYGRETQIRDMRKEQLAPAEEILTKMNDQKTQMQGVTDEVISQLEALADQDLGVNEVTKRVDELAQAWHNVNIEIDKANKLAAKEAVELGNRPKRMAGETNKAFSDRVALWEKKKEEIENKRKLTVSAAKAKVNLYAGGMVNYKGSNESPPAQMMGGGKVMKYGMGKMVKGYSVGKVVGEGSRDSVSAMLTPGEFVIRKAMVNKYGIPMLNDLNQGSFSMPTFNTGEQGSTNVSGSSGSNTNVVAPMYNNYSVSVNVSGSNSTADEVANKVMFKMKQLQNQNIRGNRG